MKTAKYLILVAIIVCLISVCFIGCAKTESDGEIVYDMMGREVKVNPGSYSKVVCIGAGALRLYSSVWSYASVIELINVIEGCILFEMCSFLYKTIANIPMPRSYYLIQVMMLILLVGGTRFFYRIVKIYRWREKG